jgi:hypothetical protein
LLALVVGVGVDLPDLANPGAPLLTTAGLAAGRWHAAACHGRRRPGAQRAPLVAAPESYLVDDDNHLLAGEPERASAWGGELAGAWAATGTLAAV